MSQTDKDASQSHPFTDRELTMLRHLVTVGHVNAKIYGAETEDLLAELLQKLVDLPYLDEDEDEDDDLEARD